jgi:hypothetical protein
MMLLRLIDLLRSSLIVPTCNWCDAAASIDRFASIVVCLYHDVEIDVDVAVLLMSKILSIWYCSWWIVGKWWLFVMSVCFSPLIGSKK